MKRENEIAKGKPAKNASKKPEPKGAYPLDPCVKPQAQEASRLKAADEACDDGVH